MKHLILFFVIAACCGCDSELNIADQGVVDPYLVGNYWVYDVQEFDSTGAISSRSEDSIAVKDIYSDRIVMSNEVEYIRRSDGIYYSNGDLLYKFPAFAQDTMFQTDTVMTRFKWGNARATISSFVEAVNVPVGVIAGNFVAYKYRVQAYIKDGKVGWDMISYYSPSIGLIKSEYFAAFSPGATPRLATRTELVRYKIR